MSFLPGTASFEEVIQDCFLAYRGTGLMLNALDAELLSGWAQADVPVDIVARGIRVAAERASWDQRPGEPALRSLRQCKRWVDAEIKKFKRASAGAGEDPRASKWIPPEVRWHKELQKTLLALTEGFPALTPTVETLLQRHFQDAPVSTQVLTWRDELVWASLLRALPFPQRLGLMKAAQVRASDSASPRARRLAQRFARMLEVKRALGLDR